jgi:intracellular sulfur oxidation DsrE/DsrF family protein
VKTQRHWVIPSNELVRGGQMNGGVPHSARRTTMNHRREFLGYVGALAALTALDSDDLKAAAAQPAGKWDMSWVDALSSASYRVVFNAEDIADGAAMSYAETFLDHFHEAQGTADAQTRPVIVFRRLGTPMALDDVLLDRYAIGEDAKITDSRTQKPATRNIYKKQLEELQRRGLISLVCNIALGNWSARAAQRTKRKVGEVIAEARANLIPGAIVVPSGIFALIRAQNAGCAFMPGT